jgi:hypothetical protein
MWRRASSRERRRTETDRRERPSGSREEFRPLDRHKVIESKGRSRNPAVPGHADGTAVIQARLRHRHDRLRRNSAAPGLAPGAARRTRVPRSSAPAICTSAHETLPDSRPATGARYLALHSQFGTVNAPAGKGGCSELRCRPLSLRNRTRGGHESDWIRPACERGSLAEAETRNLPGQRTHPVIGARS